MILIGTMDWASTRLKGVFDCPNCSSAQNFRLRASRPFLTLYFIPFIPIGGVREYVQCMSCKNAFEPLILSNHMLPDSAAGASGGREGMPLPSFEQDLLNVLALIMVEDGHVTEEEIRLARRLYENIAEENLLRDHLGRACSDVRLQRLNTLSYLATCTQRRSHEEKLLLVQAMFGVAGADGELTPRRMHSLLQAKNVMNLDESEFQRAIDSTSQWLN